MPEIWPFLNAVGRVDTEGVETTEGTEHVKDTVKYGGIDLGTIRRWMLAARRCGCSTASMCLHDIGLGTTVVDTVMQAGWQQSRAAEARAGALGRHTR